jgi:hypothetical protein
VGLTEAADRKVVSVSKPLASDLVVEEVTEERRHKLVPESEMVAPGYLRVFHIQQNLVFEAQSLPQFLQ